MGTESITNGHDLINRISVMRPPGQTQKDGIGRASGLGNTGRLGSPTPFPHTCGFSSTWPVLVLVLGSVLVEEPVT